MQLNRLTGTNRISDEYSLLNDNADILEQYAADTDAAIQAAQQAADAAQDTADQAVQDASQAQQTADTAVTAAAAAQLTANSAVSAAATAQQTAEDAQDAADAAQQTADDAGSGLATHMADDVRHLTAADRTKFASIQPGAQVNQNAIAQINDIEADSPTDALTIAGGTGISISTNQLTKTVNITATGTSTPGPHASSHLEDGSDPIPLASVTNGGLMSAQDKQDLEAAKQAIEQGQTIPAPIQRGVNVVNSDQPSGATFNVLGCTLVNILGRDGGCESMSGMVQGGSGTKEVSTEQKRDGNSSVKIDVSASSGYVGFDIDYRLDPSKSYLLVGWVYISSYTSGPGPSLRISPKGSFSGALYTANTNTGIVGSWQLVYFRIPAGHTVTDFRAHFGAYVSATWTAFFDSIRLYEISAADYAAIGTTITGEAIDQRWPYVDSVQPLRGVSVLMPGKNLLKGVPNTLASGWSLVEPYKLVHTRTAAGQHQSIGPADVKPGQQYTFKYNRSNGVVLHTRIYKADGTYVTGHSDTNADLVTFTTVPDAVRVTFTLYANTNNSYEASDWMLVLGDASNLPPSFEPYSPRYAHADIALYSNVDRTIADSYDSSTGQVFRRWRTGVKLDGTYNAAFGTDFVGYKEITIPRAQFDSLNADSINLYLTRFDGRIFRVITPTTGGDQARVGGSNVIISVADADSGWTETLNPNANAVKALLNGWRANGNNGTVYNSWESILDGSVPPTNTEAYVAVNKAPGWDCYATLDYVRATPVIEQLTGDLGALDVVSGGNTVELLEGVVVREKVIQPKLDAGAYFIMPRDASNYWGDSRLAHNILRFIAVYKGENKDLKWRQGTGGTSIHMTISAAEYDPDAEYYVDYVVLDRYAYTANVIDATLTYQSTLGGAVAQATQDIAALKRHEGVQDWAIDWTEAKADNIRFDLDTHTADADIHTTAAEKTKLAGIAAGAQVNRPIATQAQAEAGTDNTTDMSPLRTKQYVDQRLRNNIIWRINNGAPEWSNNGGGTWSPVASVKSIQRGSVDFGASGGASTVNVTISAVDMAKSILLVSTRGSYSSASGGLMTANATIKFLSNTEIQLQVSSTSSGSAYGEWQVLEYN